MARSLLPISERLSLGLLILGIGISIEAQTAHFAGVETVVAAEDLSHPHQVAVDSSGNVYIADVSNNRVLKETPTAGGYQESVIASTGLSGPGGVAVDSSGNVFVADSGNNRVIEEQLSNGAYTEVVIPITGLNTPISIAVNGNEDLYIADWGNARVVKESWIGSNYSQSLVLGGPNPDGVAVDANGNVYICATSYSEVIKMIPNGSGYSPSSFVGSGLSLPRGVTVDPFGVVYVADSGNSRILREVPDGSTYDQSVVLPTGAVQPQAITLDASGNLYFNDPTGGSILKLAWSGNFGASAVGIATTDSSLIFVFDSPGSIARPSVVTQGVTSKDFTDAGTGSCTSNGPTHDYQAGDTCTVNVAFDPLRPGARAGAALLANSTGQTIATGYLQGLGTGPAISYSSRAPISLSLPAQPYPWALAADGFGNLYIAQTDGSTCSPKCPIFKETWDGSTFVKSTIASGFQTAWGIAVDGAGNVYVADEAAFIIWKLTPQPDGTYTQAWFDSEGSTRLVATDGAGNVYIELPTGGVKIVFAEGGFVTSTVVAMSPEVYAYSMAVDSIGNLYIQGSGGLTKIAPASGGFVQTTLSGISLGNLAVDNMGNLYGADETSIIRATPSGTTYSQSTLASVSGTLAGLAVDGSGNVFFTSGTKNVGFGGATSLTEIPFSLPPSLHFAVTAVGRTSTDSPRTLKIENAGNAALIFSSPQRGTNPTIPSGFSVNHNATSACPLVEPGSAAGHELDVNASCNLTVSFSPESVKDLGGELTYTYHGPNEANSGYRIAAVPLVAAGVSRGAPRIEWATPTPITYGTALDSALLDATANLPGKFTYTPAAGTVLKAGKQTLSASFAPLDATDYTPASAKVTVVVNQATPSIKWPTPAPISYGTRLTGDQLDARAMNPLSGDSVAGAFNYAPRAGALLGAGTHTLSLAFTPTDATDYTISGKKVLLTVTKARQTIFFKAPETRLVFGAKPITLTARASSGLKVTFVVISGPARVTGDILTITGVGTIKVAARQSGNENFDAAPEVIQTIEVTSSS